MENLVGWRRRDGTILRSVENRFPDDDGRVLRRVERDIHPTGIGSLARVVTRYYRAQSHYAPATVTTSFKWRCRRCRRHHFGFAGVRRLQVDGTSLLAYPCDGLPRTNVLATALHAMRHDPAGRGRNPARRRTVLVKTWRRRDGRVRRRRVVRRSRARLRLYDRFEKVSLDLRKVIGPFYKAVALFFEDGRRRPTLMAKYITWRCRRCGGKHALEMEVLLRRDDGRIVDLLCDGDGDDGVGDNFDMHVD